MEEMLRYRWPGNVREMKNVIERAVVLARGEYIDHDDLVLSRLTTAGDTEIGFEAPPANSFQPESLADIERAHILRTLAATAGTRAGRQQSSASSARRSTAKSAATILSRSGRGFRAESAQFSSAARSHGADRRLVLADLVGLEIQRDLARCRLSPVGPMHQVHLAAGAEVAADRSRGRLQAAGGAEHLAHDANRLEPFKHRGDDRPARDEILERRIPRLLDVLGIVLLGKLRRDPQHLRRDDVEALVLKALENPPHEPPLHAVGLEKNEGPFHSAPKYFLHFARSAIR